MGRRREEERSRGKKRGKEAETRQDILFQLEEAGESTTEIFLRIDMGGGGRREVVGGGGRREVEGGKRREKEGGSSSVSTYIIPTRRLGRQRQEYFYKLVWGGGRSEMEEEKRSRGEGGGRGKGGRKQERVKLNLATRGAGTFLRIGEEEGGGK
jgi:hypothetical protein